MASWSVMSDVPNPLIDGNGDPFSGAVLKAYLPGTTTSTSIAIDSSGTSPQTSITANSEGKWEVSGNEILPYIDRKHKWGIFADATDALANSPFYMGPFDNVNLVLGSDRTGNTFLTKVTAIASALAIGATVQTLGYDDAGDGGAGLYEVVAAGTATEDGGNFINSNPSGSFQLKLIATEVNVMQWGAVKNGTASDDAAVVAAIASIITNQGGEIVFPQSIFKVSSDLQLSQNGIRLRGHCWRRSIIWYTGIVDALTSNNVAFEMDHLHVTSLDPSTANHLVGDNAGTGTGICAIRLKHVDANVHHCTFSYFNKASLFASAVKTVDGVTLGFSLTIAHNYIRYCWGGIELRGVSSDTLVFDNTILDVEKFGISLGYDWTAAAQSGITADNCRIWSNLIQNVNKNKNAGGGLGDGFAITLRRGSATDVRNNYIENYDAAVGSIAYGIHCDGLIDGTYLLATEINGNNVVSNTVETTYSVWLEDCYYGGGRGNHFAGGTGSVTQQSTSRWFDFGVNFFTGSPATPYVLNGVHSFAWDPVNAKWLGSTDARKELAFDVKFLDRHWDDVKTFADLDQTPNVSGGNRFNTFTNALNIIDFDGGVAGQPIRVVSKAAITYKFTGDLKGSSADIVTAAGDITTWESDDGTSWILTGYVDVSADNSGGA